MALDRQKIEERIVAICELRKFILYCKPGVHTGGKT